MLSNLPSVALGALLLGAACRSTSAPNAQLLDELRQAHARFADVNVAIKEGYVRDPANLCLTAEQMGRPAAEGAMGIHYSRADLLGVTATAPRVNGTGLNTDFARPAVLVYEPQPDGAMKLVAIENLVFEKAWRDAGHAQPPVFESQSYVYMADDPRTPADEAHGFEPHFDMHLWLYRDNPRGVLASFNPAVRCPTAAQPNGSATHGHAAIRRPGPGGP